MSGASDLGIFRGCRDPFSCPPGLAGPRPRRRAATLGKEIYPHKAKLPLGIQLGERYEVVSRCREQETSHR
jgi:hypothetical protein